MTQSYEEMKLKAKCNVCVSYQGEIGPVCGCVCKVGDIPSESKTQTRKGILLYCSSVISFAPGLELLLWVSIQLAALLTVSQV
jgi:hypothetical protein